MPCFILHLLGLLPRSTKYGTNSVLDNYMPQILFIRSNFLSFTKTIYIIKYVLFLTFSYFVKYYFYMIAKEIKIRPIKLWSGICIKFNILKIWGYTWSTCIWHCFNTFHTSSMYVHLPKCSLGIMIEFPKTKAPFEMHIGDGRGRHDATVVWSVAIGSYHTCGGYWSSPT